MARLCAALWLLGAPAALAGPASPADSGACAAQQDEGAPEDEACLLQAAAAGSSVPPPFPYCDRKYSIIDGDDVYCCTPPVHGKDKDFWVWKGNDFKGYSCSYAGKVWQDRRFVPLNKCGTNHPIWEQTTYGARGYTDWCCTPPPIGGSCWAIYAGSTKWCCTPPLPPTSQPTPPPTPTPTPPPSPPALGCTYTAAGTCGNPTIPCYWEPTCRNGEFCCMADGKTPQCKFCGPNAPGCGDCP